MAKKGENAWNMLTKGEAVMYTLVLFGLGFVTGLGMMAIDAACSLLK